jgi:hypothetical protein
MVIKGWETSRQTSIMANYYYPAAQNERPGDCQAMRDALPVCAARAGLRAASCLISIIEIDLLLICP